MAHPLVVHVRNRHDEYCGRPSLWGNFWPLTKERNRLIVILRYAVDINDYATIQAIRKTLKGKRLGCFCAPNPCHCDIIARVANDDMMPIEAFHDLVRQIRRGSD